MNKDSKLTLIIWLKRVIGFLAIGIWVYIIYTISKSPTPFMEQAPYCMVSTMMTFALLSMAHKGLDYLASKD